MNRNIDFAEGEYYHIYNRGVEKRNIFNSDADRDRFVRLLFLSNGQRAFMYRDVKSKKFSEIDRDTPLVAIGSYCLMPNHFHILIKEIAPKGISHFMEKFSTSYAKYFNTKNERIGPLFQGRFKAKHVNVDEYLKYLIAYIHLNPIKLIEPNWKETGIVNRNEAQKYLEQYKYSSYIDYLDLSREEKDILALNEFPAYYDGPVDFKQSISDWMEFKETQT
jgi:putative transposase